MSNIIDNQKPEFGNDWQIQQIQAHDKFKEDVMARKVDIKHKELKLRISVNLEFRCVECGSFVEMIAYARNPTSISNAVEATIETCQKCHCVYEFKSGCLQLTDNPVRGIIREAI
jgi:hypothetical protein